MTLEPTIRVTYACGHSGVIIEHCADAYRQRYCDSCAVTRLPKPSDCLRAFLDRHGDSLGSMLGPIGAVIHERQSQGIQGMLAWSGDSAMFDALEGFEATRAITPYIERFELMGI